MRVVATAGHVDHGKSSLVQALTGTDPDRWDEEKRRGLTIDLGFAFTDAESGHQIGFVDVPGHVRFLKNMLAGVGSVRAAVLVVAATEGWMPQTEEHLRILEVLGVDHGFAVVTMADLVDADTLELRLVECAERVTGTFLDGAPLVACDSRSGRGLDDVRRALDALVESLPEEPDGGRPRLWVDRSFPVRGAGTVVTGTLTGGRVSVGEELQIAPGGPAVRVRSIQSGNGGVDRAEAGTRVALNLAGVAHDEVGRGDALVVAGQWQMTDSVDAEVTTFGPEPIARPARLKAHVGSGVCEARVRPIEDSLVRVRLDRPLPLAPGDRMVLRDPGPGVTVGGAVVVDVSPPRRTRDAVARRDLDPIGRALASSPVLGRRELARLAGLGPDAVDEALADAASRGRAVKAGDVWVAAAEAARLAGGCGAIVDEWHRERPLEPGVDVSVAADRLGIDPTVLRRLAERWPDIELDESHMRRPGHTAAVPDDPDVQRLVEALEARPFSPPSPDALGISRSVVRAATRAGLVVDVGGTLLATAAVAKAETLVREALAHHDQLTVAQVRDLLESSRRYVLPLLAHFDSTGVTTRRGDVRVPGPRSRE